MGLKEVYVGIAKISRFDTSKARESSLFYQETGIKST